MRKWILLLLAGLLLALAACAGKPAEKPPLPAPAALAEELLASGAFSDALEPAELRVGCYLYGLEETSAEEMVFYLSSGATAEEIAVFRCAGPEAAEAVVAAARARLDFQAASYADYAPDEVPKLERAALRTVGNTVVLCVSADDGKRDGVLDRYS